MEINIMILSITRADIIHDLPIPYRGDNDLSMFTDKMLIKAFKQYGITEDKWRGYTIEIRETQPTQTRR